ncbi:MAG: GH116 family glycosyl hydrolase [Caulobacterales bacterium]
MLRARPDGQLAAEAPVVMPFMGPRLQGQLHPDGRLEVAVWGGGDLGVVRVTRPAGPAVIGPNRRVGRGSGLHAAQSAPAVLLTGARLAGLRPAVRCAPWHETDVAAIHHARGEGGRLCQLDWGWLAAEPRGDDLLVAAGADRAELERALALAPAAIIAEADAHAARCDVLAEGPPLLRSLVQQGAHAALASIRRTAEGAFDGLAAGLNYSAPARTYYRDGYWTLQLLLRIAPHAARAEIVRLAEGVHPDGEAPSGVILGGPAQTRTWEAHRARNPRAARTHALGDWWSDHFDSPLFLVLAVGDYVGAAGDDELARDCWPVLKRIFGRYRRLAANPQGAPLKPANDRDWADNVIREGLVAYDLGLWVGALDVLARLGEAIDPQTAAAARSEASKARAVVNRTLWRGRWYAEYQRADGSAEDHLALDSLTLLRSGAAPEDRAASVLAAARDMLESRANPAQPWGDWGVMCCFPTYGRRRDLRSKTAFPFRYHNGADWPWLDAVYARERLRRGLAGWRYPLMRWWEHALDAGWASPVEYFSPPYPRGSLLQGWSSYPAAVALEFREVVLKGERA